MFHLKPILYRQISICVSAAALRYELEEEHTYGLMEGVEEKSRAPGVIWTGLAPVSLVFIVLFPRIKCGGGKRLSRILRL